MAHKKAKRVRKPHFVNQIEMPVTATDKPNADTASAMLSMATERHILVKL